MIAVEKCGCGHRACSTYWLRGIGHFCQGSGFSRDEAEAIVGAFAQLRVLRGWLTDDQEVLAEMVDGMVADEVVPSQAAAVKMLVANIDYVFAKAGIT